MKKNNLKKHFKSVGLWLVLIMLVFTVLGGCRSRRRNRSELNNHSESNSYVAPNGLLTRLERWKQRSTEHQARVEQLDESEAHFIQSLTNEELVCYNRARSPYWSNNQVSQEVARRYVEATMGSEEKYELAMNLLVTRNKIYLDSIPIGAEIESINKAASESAARSSAALDRSLRNR